jgi:collagenase-like PrtC family protease
MGLTLEQLDPVEAVITPDPETVELYRRMRPQVEHVASAVLAATEEFPWTDSGSTR